MPRKRKSKDEFMIKFILEECQSVNRKVDRLQEAVGEVQIVSAKNTIVLDEHMKRTELAEEAIKRLQNPLVMIWSWLLAAAKIILKVKFWK